MRLITTVHCSPVPAAVCLACRPRRLPVATLEPGISVRGGFFFTLTLFFSLDSFLLTLIEGACLDHHAMSNVFLFRIGEVFLFFLETGHACHAYLEIICLPFGGHNRIFSCLLPHAVFF